MSLPLPLREGAGGRGQCQSPSAPSPCPLPQGEGEKLELEFGSGLTDAELRMLLIDCLSLWGVAGHVVVDDDAIEIATSNATLRVQRAPRDMLPVRWLLHRSIDRPPRVAPSIVALLTALRNALGAGGGNRLIVGSGQSLDVIRHGRVKAPATCDRT
jgi:hypothetical protein